MIKSLIQQYRQLLFKEKKFIIVLSLIVLSITLVPTLYSYFSRGQNYYTGGLIQATADREVYLSQIEQARQGQILTYNLHTSEPQLPYFSPLWEIMGWLAKVFGWSSLFAYHFFRIVFGLVLLHLLYLIIARIFSSIKIRQITLAIMSFASGLGIFTIWRPWTLQNVYDYFGIDLWFSEGNTFLTLNHSALFIVSQICLVLIFLWLVERLDQANYKEVIGWSIVAMFLGIIHPYDLMIIYPVAAVWFMVRSINAKHWPWPQFFKLAFFVLISSLALIYFIVLSKVDVSFGGWAAQNITLSPRLINYFVGYGLLFIGYLIGIYPALKSRQPLLVFLGVWSIVAINLLYLPIQFQSRLGDGLHISVTIIAVYGVWQLIIYLKKISWSKLWLNNYFFKTFVIWIIILFLSTTNLFLIVMEVYNHNLAIYSDERLFYLTVNQKLAMDWLKNNVSGHQIILSENVMGVLIPAITGRFVYLGHQHQTRDALTKKTAVEEWFFKFNNDDVKKAAWLKSENINFVYYGLTEKKLGDFQPGQKNYLEPVFANSNVAIYRVK